MAVALDDDVLPMQALPMQEMGRQARPRPRDVARCASGWSALIDGVLEMPVEW